MLTIQVCYSRKEGPEFASCTLGGIEIAESLLDDPAVLTAAIRTGYARCREAVDVELIGTAAAAPPAPPVNPAVARMSAPPPATATSTPPPVTPPVNGNQHYYGDRKGKGQDGPPTTGSQLGGWAKKMGCLPWFEAFAVQHNLPKLCSQWNDEWARFGFSAYQAACIPSQPVPATNAVANGVAH